MRKSQYQKYFKGKKVTVMGISLLGRNIADIKFLAQCGAYVTATDVKNREQLGYALSKLEKYNIKYTLGKHVFSDFSKKVLNQT